MKNNEIFFIFECIQLVIVAQITFYLKKVYLGGYCFFKEFWNQSSIHFVT